MRVPGELSHGALLAEESLEVVRPQIGGEHLDGDAAVEGTLRAAIHHAETASSDFVDIFESGCGQLLRDPRRQVTLCWIDFGHRRPPHSCTHLLTE